MMRFIITPIKYLECSNKAEIVEEYEDKGIFKAKYVLEMKDFLDKDSHLQLTWADDDNPQVPTKYLDEEKKDRKLNRRNSFLSLS